MISAETFRIFPRIFLVSSRTILVSGMIFLVSAIPFMISASPFGFVVEYLELPPGGIWISPASVSL